VTLLYYPLVAMAGALVGAIAHETIHAVAAWALGEVVEIGWQGGLVGGPFVDFRAEARWRSEVVRKAPLVAGVAAGIVVAVTYDGVTLGWVASAAVAAGLLWSSPEDLSRARAVDSAA